MSFHVRHADLDDLDALVPLFDAYRQFYSQATDTAGARRFLEERMMKNESVVFIAVRDDGRTVGFTQLYPVFTSVGMRRQWLLNDLFVADSARRTGVAQALMTAAHEHARKTGANGVTLETQVTNRNAQALYEKLGYRRNEESRFYHLSLE